MTTPIEKRTASVVIIDPASSRRSMLSDVVRNAGFHSVNPMPSGKDLLAYLEVETPEWLLLPLQAGDGVNALQVLRILSQRVRFCNTRVSLFLTTEERECLPLAFELGLLSWHNAAYSRDEAEPQMTAFLSRCEAFGWNDPLIAADYLREFLVEKRAYRHLGALYHQLLDLFPGTASIVLRLAEVQLMDGHIKDGQVSLHQAELLNSSLKPVTESMRRRYLDDSQTGDDFFGDDSFETETRSAGKTNVLGIETCVVVDPDSAVQYAIENLLRDAGVPDVRSFSDGLSAWNWLKSNPAPGLIMHEWRLPELTGPLLLQRLRQESALVQVPIVVASSLIRKTDVGLVQEMGVSAVLDKPFDQESFFRTVVSTLQQQRCPTEQVTLERRIRQLLDASQRSEALRLIVQLEADPQIAAESKLAMRAELAFHDKNFTQARDLALSALKVLGDSLQLLSLLGKCLLKTGQTDSALKCFGRAQEMSPTNLERLCRMAEAEMDRGNANAAAEIIAQAKMIDKQYSGVLATEAGIAIAIGDHEKAVTVISQLESVGKLLAFTNNRAIALTLSGRFEEGIDLYQKTLAALPLPWARTHDAVAYNLGLAHARYGDLNKALESLQRVQRTPGTAFAKKADALSARILKVQKTGEALLLSSTSAGPEKVSVDAGTAVAEPLSSTLDVCRGDACLYQIYRGLELITSSSLAHLKDHPAFAERSTITRHDTTGMSRI